LSELDEKAVRALHHSTICTDACHKQKLSGNIDIRVPSVCHWRWVSIATVD